MNKRYEYKGLIYCEYDLSCETENYGGDLYDFYWALRDSRKVEERTFYNAVGEDNYYESYEELIEKEFYEYEV
jgi:hypothetical protein|nr:MAG TPA: protein of unknown function (DUF5470) [Caudoviricetes sp.]